MAIEYDPYLALLQRKQQSEALGKPALSQEELQNLGYGFIAGKAERARMRQELALRERAFASQDEISRKRLEMDESATRRQGISNTISGIGSIGTGLAQMEYLTGGRSGQPGWVTKGYRSVAGEPSAAPVGGTTVPAVSSGSVATNTPSYAGTNAALPAYTGAGYVATDVGTSGYIGGAQATSLTGAPVAGAGQPMISGGGAVTNINAPSAGGASGGMGWAGPAAIVAAAEMGKKLWGGTDKPWEERRLSEKFTSAPLVMFSPLNMALSNSGGALGNAVKEAARIEQQVLAPIDAIFGIKNVAGQTVICTELLRQGIVSQELIDLERKYQPNFSWETYWGYRFWADSIVRMMQKSSLFSRFVAIFGVSFLKEIAHRVEPTEKGSKFGSFILKIGVPFCKTVYKWKMRKYSKTFYAKFRMAGE